MTAGGLRIALVHPFSWPEVLRGGERYVEDLAWYLTGAGHHVEIVTGRHGPPPPRVGGDGVIRRSHRHLPAVGPLTARETFGFLALGSLLGRRLDLVHAMVPSAALAGRATGHRTVFTVLGHPSPTHTRPRLRRVLTSAAIRRATAVTVLSRSAADQVEALWSRTAAVVPIGIRLDRFTPELRPRTGPPRILFASDLSAPMKALPTALAAFGSLLERRPASRLQLVGPGDPGPALATAGARARRAVDVVGPRPPDEMPEWYRQATVTILPSRDEAQGLVLIESLACGTPVVGSSVGGPAETVDRPEVGRTAPFGDVAALADAIDRTVELAADPATPSACAQHARRWGWERVGPRHEELYRRVVGSEVARS